MTNTTRSIGAALLLLYLSPGFVQQQAAEIIYVSQDAIVPPGDYILQPGIPPCADGRENRVPDQAAALSGYMLQVAGMPYAAAGGAIVKIFTQQLQREITHTGGSLAQLLNDIGASPRHPRCVTLALAIPAGYIRVGETVSAQDTDHPMGLCDIAEGIYERCHMPDTAWVVSGEDHAVVATFINWAQDTRTVRLVAKCQRVH